MNLLSGALTALLALITKSLPSDAVKLQWLKDHAAGIYYHVRKHILLNAFRVVKDHLKNPTPQDVQDYVNLTCGACTDDERKEMIDLLINELK